VGPGRQRQKASTADALHEKESAAVIYAAPRQPSPYAPTTSVTNVRMALPTEPVTSQQPSVGKTIPVA
jgi:hypothetical protein